MQSTHWHTRVWDSFRDVQHGSRSCNFGKGFSCYVCERFLPLRLTNIGAFLASGSYGAVLTRGETRLSALAACLRYVLVRTGLMST